MGFFRHFQGIVVKLLLVVEVTKLKRFSWACGRLCHADTVHKGQQGEEREKV
jgi:hypothetical protein